MSENNEVTRDELYEVISQWQTDSEKYGWTLLREGAEYLLSKFIITRKPEPLPSEPGTLWLDRTETMWKVDSYGRFYCPTADYIVPENYAPFRRLVVAE